MDIVESGSITKDDADVSLLMATGPVALNVNVCVSTLVPELLEKKAGLVN